MVCSQSWCGLKIHNTALHVTKAGSHLDLDLTPVLCLDKLMHRCKDDLSTALRHCCSSGVDTWSPHDLWLGWGSSPLSGEDVRLESAGEARRLLETVALWLCHAVELSTTSVAPVLVQLLPCLC